MTIEDDALYFLVHSTNGDLRSTFNALELAVLSSNEHRVTLDDMENSLQRKAATLIRMGCSLRFAVCSAKIYSWV